MDITTPLYKNTIDQNGKPAFNAMFYSYLDSTALTLGQAMQYFIQLSGNNIIDAYNHFTNTIYSTADIACSFFSSQSITTNQIVCNKLICSDIEIQNWKPQFKPILFINGLNIQLDTLSIDDNYFSGLDLMTLLSTHESSCLLGKDQKMTIYNSSNVAIYFVSNKTSSYKYFTIPILTNPVIIKIKL